MARALKTALKKLEKLMKLDDKGSLSGLLYQKKFLNLFYNIKSTWKIYFV